MAYDKRDFKFEREFDCKSIYVRESVIEEIVEDDRIIIDKRSVWFDDITQLLLDMRLECENIGVSVFDTCTTDDMIRFLTTYGLVLR